MDRRIQEDEISRIVRSAIGNVRHVAALADGGLSDADGALLYGSPGAPLDSLGVVTLLAGVEELLEERLGIAVSLADFDETTDVANPFATVGALIDFTRLAIERGDAARPNGPAPLPPNLLRADRSNATGSAPSERMG